MDLFNGRLRLEKPDLSMLKREDGFEHRWFWGGIGGDEYGNPTLYFSCALGGVTWWYPTGRYQAEVELPEYGVNEWVDRVYYSDWDEGDER